MRWRGRRRGRMCGRRCFATLTRLVSLRRPHMASLSANALRVRFVL